jgi:DNA-binding LacI/PurR family transcriptional regulator
VWAWYQQKATCRHAAGHLLAHGHRHLALVVHESERAGDKASEEGFLEAVQAHRGSEATGLLIKHDGSVPDLRKRILQMLRLRHRPTGLVVCDARVLLGIIPPLYEADLKIPQDISLICRDSENFLDFLGLSVTRYITRNETFTAKLGRLVLQLAEEGHLAPTAHLVTPSFFPGSTVFRRNGR